MARSQRSGISTFFPNIFSNRDESLTGEDRWRRSEWKRAAIGIMILTVGIVIVEGIFHLTHYQAFHFVAILTSLVVLSGIPQMACDSIIPFLQPRVRFVDGRIIIRGQRLTSIGYLASYILLCMAAVGALVLGLLSHDLRDGLGLALGPAFFAYFLYSHNPLEDLKNTVKHHVDLFADPDTYDGPWGLCCRTIGIPFTGLDALMRHFNEHPEDRPLLATPQGVDLVNDILAEAHMELTTPQRSHA